MWNIPLLPISFIASDALPESIHHTRAMWTIGGELCAPILPIAVLTHSFCIVFSHCVPAVRHFFLLTNLRCFTLYLVLIRLNLICNILPHWHFQFCVIRYFVFFFINLGLRLSSNVIRYISLSKLIFLLRIFWKVKRKFRISCDWHLLCTQLHPQRYWQFLGRHLLD